MAAVQEQVIAALRGGGDSGLADRLARCMAARFGRRSSDGRPWTCRSPGCSWCRTPLLRRWWSGMERWIAAGGEPVSVAVLPLLGRPGGLRSAVSRLRRACRDVRDRAARRWPRWRGVAVAGMAVGGGTAVLLIRHAGLSREEVERMVARRWPDALVGCGARPSPCWAVSVDDAVELAHARRGVEPLRIVVLPQRVHLRGGGQPAAAEPMPVIL